MKYVYLGKIVNTHALKGEVRLISNFEYKDRVFKKDFVVYIGHMKDKEVLETYRTHKQYDMVTFLGFDDLNSVLHLRGEKVYKNKNLGFRLNVQEEWRNAI